MASSVIMSMGKHSADQEPDAFDWFNGDLADDMPTQVLTLVPKTPSTHWMNPNPELLARILDGLRKL